MPKEPLYPHVPNNRVPLYPHTTTAPVLAFSMKGPAGERDLAQYAQELVDSGLHGNKLADTLYAEYEKLPEESWRNFLRTKVTATVWHGTRRRESIADLKRNGFFSYTEKQAGDWLIEAHRRLVEKTKAGPRVIKSLDKVRSWMLREAREPYRGKFSVTGIEEAACGEGPNPFTGRPGTASLSSGWADRNPEFVWDYLHWRANPRVVDQILTEMFGKPIKVGLRVQVELRQLLNPQDMHLEQRCFTPGEIISIVPCPPKTTKQLEAEIDQLWQPLTISR